MRAAAVVVALVAFAAVAAAVPNVEIRLGLNSAVKEPIALTDEAKVVLDQVLTETLASPAAPYDGKCSLSYMVKHGEHMYVLCGDTLIDTDGKQHPIDSTMIFDIVHSGKRDPLSTDKAEVAKLVEKEKGAIAALEKPTDSSAAQMAFRQKFADAAHTRPARTAAALEPRFSEAEAEVTHPNVGFDPLFPGQGWRRLWRGFVNTQDANCYGYATNSRLWSDTGCYAAAVGGASVNLPAGWSYNDGWCAPGHLMGDAAYNPCTSLMASVLGDGLTAAAANANTIKVAVFAHLFAGIRAHNNDGLVEVGNFGNGNKVLCIGDYHYHRLDSNGQWSDKNGQAPVTPAQFADPVAEDLARVNTARFVAAFNAGQRVPVDLVHTRFCGYAYATDGLLSGRHNTCRP